MSDPATAPGTAAPRPPWWQRPRAVLWVLALIYLLSVSGRIGNVDADRMMDVSRAMLQGRLSVSGAEGDMFTMPGPDGLYYSCFGPLSSVWYLPFVGVGQVLAHRLGRFSPPMWEEFMVSFAMVPLVLALLGYLMSYWRSRGTSPARVSAGLWMMGLGTSLWPYAKLSGSDLLMTLALLAAVVHGLNWRRPRDAWLAGLWCGLAWLTRKQAEIEVPLILLFLGLRGWRLAGTRSPFQREILVPLAWLLAGFAPLILIQLGYNHARFGSPFNEPNAAIKTVWEMPSIPEWLHRVVELTVWPARGLVPYNLLAVLIFVFAWPAWRKQAADRELPLLVLVLLAENVLFFAGTWYWYSGTAYGARYLLFLVPLMALGWAHVDWPPPRGCRYAFAFGGVWAVWLAASGVLIDPQPANIRYEVMREGKPYYQNFFPWVYLQEEARVLGLNHSLPPALDARPAMHHFAFEVPDLWWCQAVKQFRSRDRPLPVAAPMARQNPASSP